MPSTIFTTPRSRELTASGAPVPGAKLYFYTSGTTTPATVYQNTGLTVAHSNPVLSDIGGLFPAIWLDTAVSYDVVCKSASGSTLWSVTAINSGVADEVVLVSEQSAEPYADVFVRFREPSGETKGVIGFTAVGDNTMSMTSYEDHRLKFRTGTPGDDTSFIDRVFMWGSALVSYLGIQSNTALGGAYLKFTTQDYSVQKGLIGFGSTTDDDIDIINSVSGGHIELSTSGTGRVKLPSGGSVSAPMLTIKTSGGADDTGFFSDATDTLKVAVNGTLIQRWLDAGATFYIATTFPDGTVSTPGIGFTSNSQLGIYRPGSNTIGFTANGTNSVSVTETGISLKDGVTAPSTVAGYAQIYVDTSDGDLKVKFGDGTVKTIVVDT